jgi:integrase
MPLKNEAVADAVKLGNPPNLSDGHGLRLRVRGPGVAYWIMNYRQGAKVNSKSLGRYSPEFGLTAARRARNGFDVERRAAPRPITAGPAPALAVTAGTLFADAALTYRKNHADEWSPRQQAGIAALFRNHCGPIDGLPVNAVSRDNIADVLRLKWRGPGAGSMGHLRQLIEHVLDAAGVKPDDNPASWRNLKAVLSKKTVKAKHHPAMLAADLPAFMRDVVIPRKQKPGRGSRPASADDAVIVRCLKFCILTAVRTSEAIGADWSEIDVKKKLWTIPAGRMKMDRDHAVPLTDAAIALLGKPQKAGLVFRVLGTRSGAITPTGLDKLLKRHRSGVTVHGFRATFGTWAQDAEFNSDLIDVALAHKIGDETRAAYLRSDLSSPRRKLMDAWARFGTS